jgi:hypothetical protein
MLSTTSLDLFAGIPVNGYAESRKWYERLLGSPPTFRPHDTEAVLELAKHRYVYIVEEPNHAGHARLMLFVERLDRLVASIKERGLTPATKESYPNSVWKISYRDPDGNEISFGGTTKRRSHQRPQSGRHAHSSARALRVRGPKLDRRSNV